MTGLTGCVNDRGAKFARQSEGDDAPDEHLGRYGCMLFSKLLKFTVLAGYTLLLSPIISIDFELQNSEIKLYHS